MALNSEQLERLKRMTEFVKNDSNFINHCMIAGLGFPTVRQEMEARARQEMEARAAAIRKKANQAILDKGMIEPESLYSAEPKVHVRTIHGFSDEEFDKLLKDNAKRYIDKVLIDGLK